MRQNVSDKIKESNTPQLLPHTQSHSHMAQIVHKNQIISGQTGLCHYTIWYSCNHHSIEAMTIVARINRTSGVIC